MRNQLPSAATFISLALLAMVVQAGSEEPTAAVWKVQEADFSYRSTAAIYTCGALQARVATILRAVGAREDVEVSVSNCERSVVPQEAVAQPGPQQGPMSTWQTTPSDRLLDRRANREQLSHVHVRLLMPTEVTSEVLAEMERDKKRRELVSRVTGDPRAQFDDPVVFTAQWQPVTLTRQSIGLAPEECELLEQMSTSVFKKLNVRVIRRGTSCNRYRVSHIPPQLTVEALMGTPLPGPNIQLEPESSEGDADPGAASPTSAPPSNSGSATTPE